MSDGTSTAAEPMDMAVEGSNGDGGPRAGTGLVLSLGGKKGGAKGGVGGAGARNGGAGRRGSNHMKRVSAFGGQAGDEDEDEEGDGPEQGAKSHYIRSLDDKHGKKEKVEKPPMVIAVPVPRWNRREEEGAKEGRKEEHGAPPPLKKKGKTLEEEAAEALAREARGERKDEDEEEGEGGKEGERVIALQPLAHRRLDVGEDAPMLVKNAVPVPKDITDEKARLQYELSLREDDIDSSSNVYKMVPVEEFGAALLRGMGWAGPSADDHSDYGCLTLLNMDDSKHALQAYTAQGVWTFADPIPHTLLVNIGDMLSRCHNPLVRSFPVFH
ncbi:hypothetical protein VYU27_007596 [Nannochloropsis oceanica]